MNLETPVIKIIIADDHDLLRYGLTTMLSKQAHMIIVAEATTGEELINLTRKYLPDIILIDIKMPVIDGIEAARIISGEYPKLGSLRCQCTTILPTLLICWKQALWAIC